METHGQQRALRSVEGVEGIEDDVHQDLLELLRLHHDLGNVGVHLPAMVHMVESTLVLQQRPHPAENVPGEHRFHLAVPGAGIVQKPSNDSVDAQAFTLDGVENLHVGTVPEGSRPRHVGEGDDGSQRIADFVGDSSREGPHRSQPRLVNELILGPNELQICMIEGLDVLRQSLLVGDEAVGHGVDGVSKLFQLQARLRRYAVAEIALGDKLGVARQRLQGLDELLSKDARPEQEDEQEVGDDEHHDEENALRR